MFEIKSDGHARNFLKIVRSIRLTLSHEKNNITLGSAFRADLIAILFFKGKKRELKTGID